MSNRDLILSDVHIHDDNTQNQNRASLLCEKLGNNEVYLSHFNMRCSEQLKIVLAERTAPSKCKSEICSDQSVPQMDEDGDLLLDRKSTQGYFDGEFIIMSIYHSMASTLEAVGLQVWRGALLMNDYILDNLEMFEGKNILELGGGVGLTSFTVGMVSESTVVTDIGASNLRLCEKNLSLNSMFLRSEANFEIRELDWLKGEDNIRQLKLQKPDIILACDVVYDNFLTDAFFRTLFSMLTTSLFGNDNDKPITVLITIEKRMNFTLAELDVTCKEYDHFRKCLRELEAELSPTLSIQPIDVSNVPEYCQYERVPQLEIWKFTHVFD